MTRFEVYLSGGRQILERIKDLFPVDHISKAVKVFCQIISSTENAEPNLALSYLFLRAVKTAFGPPPVQGGKKRKPRVDDEEGNKLINWEDIAADWEAFVHVTTKLFSQTVLEKLKHQSSEEVVLYLYEVIQKYAAISENAPAFAGLQSFLSAVTKCWDEEGKRPSGKASQTKDSRLSLDLSEVKILTLIFAQAMDRKDIRLCLSENRVFLAVTSDGSGIKLVDIPDYEYSMLPKIAQNGSGQSVNQPAAYGTPNLWLCSGGQFVSCSRHMEVAFFVCNLEHRRRETVIADLGKFQRGVLDLLHRNQHISTYPMALAIFGSVESECGDLRKADNLFSEAVAVNRTKYQNAFVFPYCYLMEHLIRDGKCASALVAMEMAARVASNYVYITDFDKALHDELYHMMEKRLPDVLSTLEGEKKLGNPIYAALLLSFIDNLCVWEENGSHLIIHSIWARQLGSEIKKVTSALEHVDICSLPDAVLDVNSTFLPPTDYLNEMKSFFDNGAKTLPIVPQPSVDFCCADLCKRALDLYIQWPPFHANHSHLLPDDDEIIIVPEADKQPERFQELQEFFKSLPVPRISSRDLDSMAGFREINPLYETCFGHVFPFKDMGPCNIAMASFDFTKMKQELVVPRPGTREYFLMAAFNQRYKDLRGEYYVKEGANREGVQIFVRSKKMNHIRSLLAPVPRTKEIDLALSAQPGSSDSSDRASRRVSRF